MTRTASAIADLRATLIYRVSWRGLPWRVCRWFRVELA